MFLVKRLQIQQGPKTVLITWFLLVSLFCESIQDTNGKESDVSQCGPKNVKVTDSYLTILLTWEDDPSCLSVEGVLIYEVVLRNQEVHKDEVVVMPEQIGSIHSWNWTLSLPVECVSHTVKIRSKHNNYESPWIQKNLTAAGGRAPSRPEVYPKDEKFAVNSNATFCCVLPAGDVFKGMSLTGYDNSKMRATKINNRTYALTVLLEIPSYNTCTHVDCESSSKNAACAWISYPPDDSNLKCETRDVESVDCYWMVGRNTQLPKTKISTKYQLNGRNCPNSKNKCSLKIEDHAVEGNWTLTAQNELGKVELTDRADLLKRVHMFAPVDVSPSAVNARNVTLMWKWGVQRYHDLDIRCQIKVSHGETSSMSEASGVGVRSAAVMDLTPNWSYNVTIRCGTTQHLWKWGDWSRSASFQTRGDIPDAVDVWMLIQDNQTFIVWKELQAHQSHGDILEFEVSWAKTTEQELQNTTLTEPSRHNVSLSVDPTKEYIVTVTARNVNGTSSPSTIIIPRLTPDRTTVITSRISGSNGGFNLSWSASPAASCGYIVDWCPTLGSCRAGWLKVSPHQTKARIVSNFEDGQRYLLSVYACTHTAPVLLERREGYVKERGIEIGLFKSLKWKQQGSNVEVSWEPVSLRSQSAFIVGYVLYCLDNSKIVCNVSTDNPEATTLTAANLKINTYTFTVKAKTAAGECGDSSTTATLSPLTDDLIQNVIISLVSVFGLLSLVTFLCFRNWSCIKHKVYPPIPKPVLTDKWLTTGTHHLHVDQYLHSEADIMDVPELHCKLGTCSDSQVNDYVIQENLPYVSAQSLKSYYNHSVKNCAPQPLSLPTTAIPSQSGPPNPFKSLIPNPSYSLTMEMEYQPLSPEPEGGVHPEEHCNGYKPQSQTANLSVNQTDESADRPMSCVFTYVLLPQVPATEMLDGRS